MLKAKFEKLVLEFKRPAGTSRGVMHDKPTYFIKVWDENDPHTIGTGECSTIKGLSYDDRPEYENVLEEVCERIDHPPDLDDWPSIQFGLEMAMLDLHQGGTGILFPSEFTDGTAAISINGLIWMGEPEFMNQQIKEKLKNGYDCLKLKIGAIDFDKEMEILTAVRNDHPDLEIRVDANGAFDTVDALEKLDCLAALNLHSIEQPIKPGQWDEMRTLCEEASIPIALDEELIGYTGSKTELLKAIAPRYIILKPSLIGGFAESDEWIDAAESLEIGWWATSALESNIGLNAIAQWVYPKKSPMPQGLGTGQLYTNNVESRLRISNGELRLA